MLKNKLVSLITVIKKIIKNDDNYLGLLRFCNWKNRPTSSAGISFVEHINSVQPRVLNSGNSTNTVVRL